MSQSGLACLKSGGATAATIIARVVDRGHGIVRAMGCRNKLAGKAGRMSPHCIDLQRADPSHMTAKVPAVQGHAAATDREASSLSAAIGAAPMCVKNGSPAGGYPHGDGATATHQLLHGNGPSTRAGEPGGGRASCDGGRDAALRGTRHTGLVLAQPMAAAKPPVSRFLDALARSVIHAPAASVYGVIGLWPRAGCLHALPAHIRLIGSDI
ncbi:hypothetical protein UA08_08233 [Talaromyces atroroseus]|uniref:Uncharacterized protein n=1 Tax=Talaromyces atroroseus TaxID=1441469 RepID=A0A225AST9_TALAT|nr:hypothetical protein UA08_08233 [Talaromyces atroroseus]OKL56517.1 hypothetical protein UA08_08233 [Talaromyces atroroseus]